MKKLSFAIILVLCGGWLIFSLLRGNYYAMKANQAWQDYKYFFIDSGRVKRPLEKDSVSEGQSYAMLRAVFMDDQAVFDECYRFSEENLSRKNQTSDNLLAWHWKDGQVLDWMPASDADIDYAVSLIFAYLRWGRHSPPGLEPYDQKARAVLKDILALETFRTDKGNLFLLPWIVPNKNDPYFPINPSYYSPAYFRIFYKFTKDKQWLELTQSSYTMLFSLSDSLNGKNGVGLIPDWCRIDREEKFLPFTSILSPAGWDSLRIPFRIYLDLAWFNSSDAQKLISYKIADFVEAEWKKEKKIFAKYFYSGKAATDYEHPLSYAAYYLILKAAGSSEAPALLKKLNSFLTTIEGRKIYLSQNEYFANSLCWLAEEAHTSRLSRIGKRLINKLPAR